MEACFVDLDRTLLSSASGPVLSEALVAEGVLSGNRKMPGDQYFYRFYNRVGETVPAMGLARAMAWVARGWSQDAVARAGKRAVPGLTEIVQPFALAALAEHRAAGRKIVLATTTPIDMIRPLAAELGFDDVVATTYEVDDGIYTGRLEEGFCWGLGKLQAVKRWCKDNLVELNSSHAFSDSFFDLPLLSSVGYPHVVNADARLAAVALVRRWPSENWDRPPGIPTLVGFEPQDLLRPIFRPESFPYVRFRYEGLEHVPDGPIIVAANHRSYFDFVTLAILAAKLRRPVRFLGKKEMFDVPVLGVISRAIGGIAVDRGGNAASSLADAEQSLAAGEAVVVLPQGTIPRGEAFFDPLLKGKTGTARLAMASGAPVVPVGLWGTEKVWPRNARAPKISLTHRHTVVVRVGAPLELSGTDAGADTDAIMRAITALLPEEARSPRQPSAEELAATFPPGQAPTPESE